MANPAPGLLSCLLLMCAAAPAYSPQNPTPPPPPGATMSPQQLDDLVAPVALYPDPMLAQVLAASTYPMEVAEAEQWVHDHSHWRPSKLMDKAKRQNWDPSVQSLVAFPDVLDYLTQNMNWTTQLGNAFLAQQQDVMQAVQRMRASAEEKGTLRSTAQQTVTTQEQGGQREIVIEPADPEVWYVPNYNPMYVWGPPVWGAYPPLMYPGVDVGWDWYPGIDLGLSFGGWGGWGWGGWGWTPNWYGGGVFVDHSFFHRYGFQQYGGGGWFGNSAWAHNPEHRLGVPYANREVAGRFAGGGAYGMGAGRLAGPRPEVMNRGGWPANQRFGTGGFEQRGWAGNHSVFGGYHNGGMARMQSDRGFASMGAGRIGGFGGGMRSAGAGAGMRPGGFGGGGMRPGGFGGGMRGGRR
ncbi:MAG TPA: DUF3300 domain-containing protein [Candidatus Sulfopaludibacter sp.]|nr:DUF3300 domain-containing protein [Candidatus Sulfopaludibacter sp.]